MAKRHLKRAVRGARGMQGHFGTPRSGATLHVHDMTLYCMNRSFLANSCTQCAGVTVESGFWSEAIHQVFLEFNQPAWLQSEIVTVFTVSLTAVITVAHLHCELSTRSSILYLLRDQQKIYLTHNQDFYSPEKCVFSDQYVRT